MLLLYYVIVLIKNGVNVEKGLYSGVSVSCQINNEIYHIGYTTMSGVILTQIIIHERPNSKLKNKGESWFLTCCDPIYERSQTFFSSSLASGVAVCSILENH